MKSLIFGTILLGLSVPARSAEAVQNFDWIQIPGSGREIGVGASNYPWVIDLDDKLEWYDRTNFVCGDIFCVTVPIWRADIAGKQKHLSVDLYGYAWTIDINDTIFWGGDPDRVNGFTTNLSTCMNQFAQGFIRLPAGANYTYPDKSGHVNVGTFPVGDTWMIACGTGNTQLLQSTLTAKFFPTGPIPAFTHTPVTFQDSGEHFVTLFTVDGSSDQVPWIIAPLSGGGDTIWAVTGGQFVAAPKPGGFSVTYATDHYVVANNQVWRWNGDAFGRRGRPAWSLIADAPAHKTIKQIAYASVIPDTAQGPVGPSDLWMIDTENNIYYWGNVTPPA